MAKLPQEMGVLIKIFMTYNFGISIFDTGNLSFLLLPKTGNDMG